MGYGSAVNQAFQNYGPNSPGSVLNAGYKSGAFSPTGEGDALNSLMQYLKTVGEGNIRQAQLGSDLYTPNDPWSANYARMNAEQSNRNTLAQSLAGARTQFSSEAMNHLWQLLMQHYSQQFQLANRPQQQSQIPGLVGTLGGALIGTM